MKGSLLLFLMFSLGVLAGLPLPGIALTKTDISVIILFLLMFFVGLNLGSSKELIDILKKTDFQILAIPIITITGTLPECLFFLFYKQLFT
jgi:uncharacterized membrane protein YbjE (DUF340 family)